MLDLPLPPAIADAIYTILVDHAGAYPDERDDFVRTQGEGCTEWRFRGRLGWGGKLFIQLDHRSPHHWGARVSCYQEDRTAERDAIIAITNAALTAYIATTEPLPAFG